MGIFYHSWLQGTMNRIIGILFLLLILQYCFEKGKLILLNFLFSVLDKTLCIMKLIWNVLLHLNLILCIHFQYVHTCLYIIYITHHEIMIVRKLNIFINCYCYVLIPFYYSFLAEISLWYQWAKLQYTYFINCYCRQKTLILIHFSELQKSATCKWLRLCGNFSFFCYRTCCM